MLCSRTEWPAGSLPGLCLIKKNDRPIASVVRVEYENAAARADRAADEEEYLKWCR